jgi:hypothetical protein
MFLGVSVGLPQHPDQHRPKRPILLASIKSSAKVRGLAGFPQYEPMGSIHFTNKTLVGAVGTHPRMEVAALGLSLDDGVSRRASREERGYFEGDQ